MIIVFVLVALFGHLNAGVFDALDDVPAMYNGRVIPLGPAARDWVNEHFVIEGQPSDFFWRIHLQGHEPWDSSPIIKVSNKDIRKALGLNLDRSSFSYLELSSAINPRLISPLVSYYFIKAYNDPFNRSKREKIELTALSPGLWVKFQGDDIVVESSPETGPWKLLNKGTILYPNGRNKTQEINKLKNFADGTLSLFSTLNLYQTLGKQAELRRNGSDLAILPGRYSSGDWYPLSAIHLPLNNFTAFSNSEFAAIKDLALQLEKENEKKEIVAQELSQKLQDSYRHLDNDQLPSYYRLTAEKLYDRLPLLTFTLALYALACLALPFSRKSGLAFLIAAFALHTFTLAMRCFILQRPPVSNMAETVIYVPWVSCLISLSLYAIIKNRLALFLGSLTSFLLLLVLKLTYASPSLENIQPVLNSQFWLTIHVLMVVGSYGAFVLAGVLGHAYIIAYFLQKRETPLCMDLSKLILQTLYIGTALLTIGTILGGIWAAQSWGRFWDWDPKESWAFISICTYLIWIHTYRFGRIGNFTLAIGAIIGLQAISFTWYGVNYILGTGFHSYGFGSGGEAFYYLFLILEAVFITASVCFYKKRRYRV